MQRWFRHPEDVIPVCCIVGLFAADVAVYFLVHDVRLLAAWLCLAIWPKMFICAWNHHHQHLFTFHAALPNRLLEVVYALHTGITTNAWVLHHVLGHHVNYLDQTKDESAWKRRDGTTMGEIEYTLTIAATGYLRAFRVARRYPRQRAGFVWMTLVVIGLLAAAFWHDPVNAVFVFAAPMLFGYLVTCWHTYAHHAGLDTENPYEASHNILHRSYNLLTGNLGYHTAHHVKPKLHWSKLPAFHASIADRIPPHLYQEPFFPISLLPAGTGGSTAGHAAPVSPSCAASPAPPPSRRRMWSSRSAASRSSPRSVGS